MLRGARLPGDRWTVQDQSVAVALQDYEDDLDPNCGHPMTESMDPGAERVGGNGDHYYECPPPARCHACDEIALRVEQTLGGNVTAARPQALRFHAVRRERKAVSGADVRR